MFLLLLGKSGSGKSTIERKLINELGFNKTISFTTRKPRNKEKNGVDYHFVSEAEFLQLRQEGKFAESAIYNGNYYGTGLSDCRDGNLNVIEPQGFNQIKENKHLNVVSIYLDTSQEKRIKNMKKRGDSSEKINERIENDRRNFKGIKDKVDYVLRNEKYTDLEVIINFISKLKTLNGKIPKNEAYTITNSGKLLNVFKLQEGDLLIEDVAHALSQVCRWNGHCKYHYSVAQHSIMVKEQIEKLGGSKAEQLFGLLHDASEAYICDIPKPIKAHLPDYITIEDKLQSEAYNQLIGRTPSEKERTILDAVDLDVLYKESIELTNFSSILLGQKTTVDSDLVVEKRNMKEIEKEFLAIYYKLIQEYKREER